MGVPNHKKDWWPKAYKQPTEAQWYAKLSKPYVVRVVLTEIHEEKKNGA